MPSPATAFPAPALDAARERVVRLLTDRYADDTLTVEAFEAQLDRMHALTSVEALDAMAGELAAPTVPAVPGPTALTVGPTAPVAPSPGRRVGRLAGVLPARLNAFMSSTKRAGAWVVPPHARIAAVMSEVVLDLRGAVLPPECEIEVFALMGNVSLHLPPGVEALVDVDAFMAAVSDRRRGRLGSGDGPLVRVTGRAMMAEVKIRRDDW